MSVKKLFRFTPENFVEFLKKLLAKGMSIDFRIFSGEDSFGFFELDPYNDGRPLKYSFHKVSYTNDGFVFDCQVRVNYYHIGDAKISENELLSIFGDVKLYGSFDETIIELYNSVNGINND